MMTAFLSTARLHWQMGSWEKLGQMQMDIPQKGSVSRDHAELLLYRMQGLFVSGRLDEGRELARTLLKSGVNRRSLIAALLSGTHSNVARAHLKNGRRDLAKSHIARAIAANPESGEHTLVESLRFQNEQRQISQELNTDVYDDDVTSNSMLDELGQLAPKNPFVIIALAERAQWQKDFPSAIKHWQNLASIQGDAMPQTYYDRLSAAYASQRSFPLASPEKEVVRGGVDKHKALKAIHQILRPSLYLEIGVQSGKSLKLATGQSIGIDPMPMLTSSMPSTARILEMSSDYFFSHEAAKLLKNAPDLVFIDGMHLFEFALRDFINVERFSEPDTIIVIDDIFPNHSAQAQRERCTRAWTGDVWKLHDVLRKYRPDLNLVEIDAFPTGLLLVQNLDKGNNILSSQYDEILSEYMPMDQVPAYYIEREGVDIDSFDSLRQFFHDLVSSRDSESENAAST